MDGTEEEDVKCGRRIEERSRMRFGRSLPSDYAISVIIAVSVKRKGLTSVESLNNFVSNGSDATSHWPSSEIALAVRLPLTLRSISRTFSHPRASGSRTSSLSVLDTSTNRHTLNPASCMHAMSLASRAKLINEVPDGPEVYGNLRRYEFSNVASVLVASGLIIFAIVLEGRAAGVIVTDTSRPPEARMGATSMGKTFLYAGGSGVCVGQVAIALTSCECRRRLQVCTQWLDKP